MGRVKKEQSVHITQIFKRRKIALPSTITTGAYYSRTMKELVPCGNTSFRIRNLLKVSLPPGLAMRHDFRRVPVCLVLRCGFVPSPPPPTTRRVMPNSDVLLSGTRICDSSFEGRLFETRWPLIRLPRLHTRRTYVVSLMEMSSNGFWLSFCYFSLPFLARYCRQPPVLIIS
jgi:hypothetical protein